MGQILAAYSDSRRERASYGSIKATCGMLAREFGNLKPEHITQKAVARFAKQRLAAGKSHSTAYNDMLFLRASVNWAIKQKMVPPSAKLTFEMPVRRSPPRERWLTKDEVRRLVDGAIAPHIRLFIVIAAMTGHRREAILGLTWDGVDFERRRIDFGPGNERKRRGVVPIHDSLLRELKAARAVATTQWVVEFGGSRVHDVRRGLEAACVRAGVARITPHVFRHTAATWMVMAGTPTREVARMLGMSEVMVERTYGKHAPDYLDSAASALDFSSTQDVG
ncbi:tyrosine-type recombinase/integrase [Roseospira marina]